MRVLVINSIYPTPNAPKTVGGAEVFARMLAERLVSTGAEVEVIRAASSDNQPVESQNGVVVHSAKVRNVYYPFSQRRGALKRLMWHAIDDWRRPSSFVSDRIRTFHPDVLHTNNLAGLTTGVWDAAQIHRIPIVHTLHDYYLTCPRSTRFAKGCACRTTCFDCKTLTVRRRQMAKAPLAVVGVSQRTLDIHANEGLFRETPIKTVIRNAAPSLDVAPPRDQIRGPVVLGFIGRMAPEKGLERLVRALGLLPAGTVRLKIAGRADEAEQKRLRDLAPRADINFLGFVNAADFYSQVDVVAAPSIWEEPGALVLAEARAAGRPILTTRFGGNPEAVKDGATGWLTNGEPEDIARRVLQLVADPTQITIASRNARQSGVERTFDSVVKEYRDLFDAVVTGKELLWAPGTERVQRELHPARRARV
jgi:glycosyltransferase involved in cell wall biosynthesis